MEKFQKVYEFKQRYHLVPVFGTLHS